MDDQSSWRRFVFGKKSGHHHGVVVTCVPNAAIPSKTLRIEVYIFVLLINHREKTMSWPCFPCFPAHQEPPVNKRHSARLETAKSNSFNQSAREKNAWNKSTSYKRHRRFLNATSTLNFSKLDHHYSNASDVFFKITGSCGQTPLLNTFFFVLTVAAFDDDSHLQDHSEDEFEQF